ncbi:dnaJ domain-containing protein [Ditylenchus destructor]|uniref:DnaJ domain-containing protein n=1 Tax=Ditylenchus destructor TaxID=166010 RepID=A0AAD4QV12_9BILA|nr:dnaJ domain-containing protein [Ditylenchus destructor]
MFQPRQFICPHYTPMKLLLISVLLIICAALLVTCRGSNEERRRKHRTSVGKNGHGEIDSRRERDGHRRREGEKEKEERGKVVEGRVDKGGRRRSEGSRSSERQKKERREHRERGSTEVRKRGGLQSRGMEEKAVGRLESKRDGLLSKTVHWMAGKPPPRKKRPDSDQLKQLVIVEAPDEIIEIRKAQEAAKEERRRKKTRKAIEPAREEEGSRHKTRDGKRSRPHTSSRDAKVEKPAINIVEWPKEDEKIVDWPKEGEKIVDWANDDEVDDDEEDEIPEPPPLPEEPTAPEDAGDWCEVTDAKSGKPYYYRIVNGTTQDVTWEKPPGYKGNDSAKENDSAPATSKGATLPTIIEPAIDPPRKRAKQEPYQPDPDPLPTRREPAPYSGKPTNAKESVRRGERPKEEVRKDRPKLLPAPAATDPETKSTTTKQAVKSSKSRTTVISTERPQDRRPTRPNGQVPGMKENPNEAAPSAGPRSSTKTVLPEKPVPRAEKPVPPPEKPAPRAEKPVPRPTGYSNANVGMKEDLRPEPKPKVTQPNPEPKAKEPEKPTRYANVAGMKEDLRPAKPATGTTAGPAPNTGPAANGANGSDDKKDEKNEETMESVLKRIMDNKGDYYAILGIDKNADLDTIKKAHRKTVVKVHPDKIDQKYREQKDRDRLRSEGAYEAQTIVQEAFTVLSDPEKRLNYDRGPKKEEPQKSADGKYTTPDQPKYFYSMNPVTFQWDGGIYYIDPITNQKVWKQKPFKFSSPKKKEPYVEDSPEAEQPSAPYKTELRTPQGYGAGGQAKGYNPGGYNTGRGQAGVYSRKDDPYNTRQQPRKPIEVYSYQVDALGRLIKTNLTTGVRIILLDPNDYWRARHLRKRYDSYSRMYVCEQMYENIYTKKWSSLLVDWSNCPQY